MSVSGGSANKAALGFIMNLEEHDDKPTDPLLSILEPAGLRERLQERTSIDVNDRVDVQIANRVVPFPPAKKQAKWNARDDALLIEYRARNMKWKDISKLIPGRSATSCRLHYQNYLEKRCEWDEDKKNRLAREYEK
ncbi:hypothetical protein KEM52_005677 [Ascosphaera acerosa]|nr:hypothetical protein KEM52_005677 [Ascosphaera acerosa]